LPLLFPCIFRLGSGFTLHLLPFPFHLFLS
jgi:hypothetical protein